MTVVVLVLILLVSGGMKFDRVSDLPRRLERGGRSIVPWIRPDGRSPRRFLQGQVLAQALMVAATAGLPLFAALAHSRHAVPSSTARCLDDVLRRAHQIGLAAALRTTSGPLGPLFSRVARAHATGAPLAGDLLAYLEEERSMRRAAGLEEARKLPVRLSLPLALLVLPGFLLLTVAPAALGSFSRLLGPLMP